VDDIESLAAFVLRLRAMCRARGVRLRLVALPGEATRYICRWVDTDGTTLARDDIEVDAALRVDLLRSAGPLRIPDWHGTPAQALLRWWTAPAPVQVLARAYARMGRWQLLDSDHARLCTQDISGAGPRLTYQHAWQDPLRTLDEVVVEPSGIAHGARRLQASDEIQWEHTGPAMVVLTRYATMQSPSGPCHDLS
jgi:hypothetical protein